MGFTRQLSLSMLADNWALLLVEWGFLIANNHGFEHGWTRTIYGKVVLAEYQGRVIYRNE